MRQGSPSARAGRGPQRLDAKDSSGGGSSSSPALLGPPGQRVSRLRWLSTMCPDVSLVYENSFELRRVCWFVDGAIGVSSGVLTVYRRYVVALDEPPLDLAPIAESDVWCDLTIIFTPKFP